MDEWKTVEPNVWRPEKAGDTLIGILVSKEPKDESGRLSARYYLENDNEMFLVWGSAVLDDRMQYVQVGDKIRITFEGKTKNKRNQDVNLFRVDVSRITTNEKDNSEDNSVLVGKSTEGERDETTDKIVNFGVRK